MKSSFFAKGIPGVPAFKSKLWRIHLFAKQIQWLISTIRNFPCPQNCFPQRVPIPSFALHWYSSDLTVNWFCEIN